MEELLKSLVAQMNTKNIASFTIKRDGSVVRTMERVVVDEFTIE